MAFKKVTTWFMSEKGRHYSYLFTGAAATGLTFATTLHHTLLIDKYKEFIQLYSNGFSVPLSKKLQQRFEKTLDLLEIDDDFGRSLIKPFHVYGFDVYSAGTTYSKYGAIIGVPKNFSYENTRDMNEDRSKIKLGDKSIPWDTDEGKKLADSLVLSENAQLYAIAREIKYRQSYKPLFDMVLPVTSYIFTYGLSSTINRRLDLYTKPLVLRLINYALVVCFTFGLYAMGTDVTQVSVEYKIDKELKSNQIFKEGGQEFYSKLLEKNIALRKLLGSEGERLYTALGNEQSFLRTKHIPFVERKRFFEQDDVDYNLNVPA